MNKCGGVGWLTQQRICLIEGKQQSRKRKVQGKSHTESMDKYLQGLKRKSKPCVGTEFVQEALKAGHAIVHRCQLELVVVHQHRKCAHAPPSIPVIPAVKTTFLNPLAPHLDLVAPPTCRFRFACCWVNMSVASV